MALVQNCRVKHFSLLLFTTSAITQMSGIVFLSSFRVSLLAYILTALVFSSKRQHDSFGLLNRLYNCCKHLSQGAKGKTVPRLQTALEVLTRRPAG